MPTANLIKRANNFLSLSELDYYPFQSPSETPSPAGRFPLSLTLRLQTFWRAPGNHRSRGENKQRVNIL